MSLSLPGRWSQLFRRRPARGSVPARGRGTFRPALESLEVREVPASFVWTGAGATPNWNDANNWLGNAAPTAGSDLLFPGGAAQMGTTFNNFTGGNAVFNSLTLDAPGYALQGSNGITLGAGGLTVNSATAGGGDAINIPITLGANLSITDTYAGNTLQVAGIDTTASAYTVTFAGSGAVNSSAAIAGAGAVAKSGPGTLLLQGANTYTGTTTISAGTVQLAPGGTLGTAGTGTTVAAGATLQLLDGANTAEPLSLAGSGVGGAVARSTAGALEVSGAANVTGAITLAGDAAIGVDAGAALTDNSAAAVLLNGHALTINSAGTATFNDQVFAGSGGGSLQVNAALTGGTVTFNAAATFTGPTTVQAGTLRLAATGALASTSIGVLQGATLSVDDTGQTTIPNRIPDTANINLKGGTLKLIASASAATTEKVGTITLTGGHSTIQVNQGLPNVLGRLSATNLMRAPGATVNFSSNQTLGSANDQVVFTSVPITVGNNGGILPYATVGDTDFATYGPNGIAAFNGYVTSLTAAGPNDVVKLSGGTATVTANKAIAGLVSVGSTLTVNLGIALTIGTPAIGSGLLLERGATITPAGSGSAAVNFAGEGFVFTNAALGAATVKVQLTGNRGVDFSGPTSAFAAGLSLSPGALGSGYTGGTYLDSTNLSIQGTNPLGAAGSPVNLVGGVLTSAAGGFTLANPINLMGSVTTLNATNLTLTGLVNLSGSNAITFAQPVTLTGKMTGAGSLTELGTGTLVINPVVRNDYSGGTTLEQGTLILSSPNSPLGTGPLTLAGGTLQNTVPGGVTLANRLLLNAPPPAGVNAILSGSNPFTFTGPGLLNGVTVLQANVLTTLTGLLSGSGALVQTGTALLALSGNNTYTGATMVEGGQVSVNGSQPASAVGVAAGTLSGAGTLGYLTVAAGGTDEPGNPGQANPNGIQTVPGANFSEGGNLTLQASGTTRAGTDYSRLNVGSGTLVLGGSAAAPATLTLDLAGLSAIGVATAAVLATNRTGVTPVFQQLKVVNNATDFAASPNYTLNGVDVTFTTAVNKKPNVPASTKIWTGLSGGDTNLTDPTNWLGNLAPAVGDDLIFPAGSAQFSLTNDFPSAVFGNITFEAGGYTLNGNAFTLQGNIVTTEPGNAAVTLTTINAPIVISAFGFGGNLLKPTYPGTSLLVAGTLTAGSTVDVAGAGTTTITGKVTGSGGLSKDGTGTFNLAPQGGTSNDYAGTTTLNAGLTIISSAGALGSVTQGTTVNDGATLQTVGTLTLAEPLTLSGYGLGGNVPGNFSGALSATAPLTLTGGVFLAGNALIDNVSTGRFLATTTSWQLRGFSLTLNTNGLMLFTSSSINDGTGFSTGGSLIVNAAGPAGQVNLQSANDFSGSAIVNEGSLVLSGNGALTGVTNINLNANTYPATASTFPGPVGVLVLDNTGTNAPNRINDNAQLNLGGGEWLFLGTPNASTSETIGIIAVQAGHSIMREVPGSGALAGLQLHATQINETVGATIDFDAPPTVPLGSNKNLLIVPTSSEPKLDAYGLLPWAVITQSNGTSQPSQVDFATYDTGLHVNGVFPFNTYALTINDGGANGVVKLNNNSATVTQNGTTFGAVLINNATLTINPGATATVNDGVLTGALRPNGGGTATVTGGGAVVFGGPSYVTTFETTNLNAAITGGSVVYGGAGTVNLAPISASTYGGTTTINSGTVSVVNANSPFGTSTVNFYAGAFSVDPALGGAFTLPNAVAFSGATMDFLPQGPLALTFSGAVTLTGNNILALPQNLTLTLSGVVTGTGGLTETGGGVGIGGGTLVLDNNNNLYAGGTTLVNQGGALPTLVLGSTNPLGTGPLTLVGGTLEASTAATVNNPLMLTSANVALGGPTPNDQAIIFNGAGSAAVTVAGNSTLTASVPVEIDDPINDLGGTINGSSGSLNLVGSFTLTGNPSLSGGNTTSSGVLQDNGLENKSPVSASAGTIYGVGLLGLISAGPGIVVQPGTPTTLGTLTAAGANFSNGGTLRLRIDGYTTPGGDYDSLDLGGNPLVVGGTSRLVIDLAGLSAAAGPGIALGAIHAGSRVGNLPLFNEVDVVNNPNNYSVELDYTTDPMTNLPVLNIVVALGATDTPVIGLPPAATTAEDIALTFSVGGGNPIVVSDLGAINPLQVTVGVTAGTGTLTLGTTAGLAFTGGANGSASMSFTGTAAAVTVAFDGLVFTPAKDYTGPSVLSLTVTNPGGVGLLGGPRTNSAMTTINVTPTADAPTFTLSGTNITVNDNAGAKSFAAWALNVQGEPPNNGNLTGLVFSTTNDDPGIFSVQPKVTLTGATGTLTFTPKPNTAGTANVTVTLANTFPDLDGDVDSSSLTFTITVNNTSAPAVTDVIIHWGTHAASLTSILAANRDVPFLNISTIDIVFNQDVVVQQSDLALSGLSGLYGFTGFSYNPKTFTATWALATVLGGTTGIDRINLTLDGTSGNAVHGRASGVKLNGGVNYVPSQINVLVGDVNGDGVVDLSDQLAIVRGLSLTYAGVSFLDIDGNGHIDMMDYYLVRSYTGHRLP